MQRLRTFLRDRYRWALRQRASIARAVVHGLRNGGDQGPKRSIQIAYHLLWCVYFAKRLLQDAVTRRLVVSKRYFAHRRREVETNLLIRLIVWRDWPIGRAFNPYDGFAENNALTPLEVKRMREIALEWEEHPLISIVVPVFRSRAMWMSRLVDSVLAQTYDRWELILVDDGSDDAETEQALRDADARDERILVHRLSQNVGVAEATNRAAELASGAWLAFADHDDELFPDALWWIAKELQTKPETDLFYTDEEIFHDSVGCAHAHFKPDFSPQQLDSHNYLCHLLVVRRELFEDVGRLRPGTEGAQDYDLVFRLTERTSRVVHIPRVLYRWHVVDASLSRRVDAKTGAVESTDGIDEMTRRVAQDHFDRLGVGVHADVVDHWVQPSFEPEEDGLVSIIVCTKDQPRRLAKCIQSIERNTDYTRYELIIVDNGSCKRSTLRLLRRLSKRHRVVRIESEADGFNFSRINNLAAAESNGEWLLFLNDDTVVQESSWLTTLVGTMRFPNVGVVGARLLYPDGAIQHAGLIVGALGWGPWHALMGVPGNLKTLHRAYLSYPHNASAVTGACLLTRRDLFFKLGGFDDVELAECFNDVDYCLRVREAGYDIAYAPRAELIHEEGASRGRRVVPEEAVAFKRKWSGYQDPYWHPSYSRLTPHFSLDPRRWSRGIGVSNSPRVLLVRSKTIDKQFEPTACEILGNLAWQGRCRLTECTLPRDASLEEIRREVMDRLESSPVDVVVAEGKESWPAVSLAEAYGIRSLWSLPSRWMLPNERQWRDRTDLLDAMECLWLPYQVVFADPYSIGWTAAGLPRANFTVVARPALRSDAPEEHEAFEIRKGVRSSLGWQDETTVLLSVIDVEDEASGGFLIEAFTKLPSRLNRRKALVLYVEGANGGSVVERLKAQNRGRSDVHVVCETDSNLSSWLAAADVALAHSVVEPRPAWLLDALRRSLPIIGTPMVEQADLLHGGVTGRVAAAFSRRAWSKAMVELMESEATRLEAERQGFYWLQSREALANAEEHWRQLIVEAAELTLSNTNLEEIPPVLTRLAATGPERLLESPSPRAGSQSVQSPD